MYPLFIAGILFSGCTDYYQYDVHGNAERVLKDVRELRPLNQHLKQTVYEFELISGNVNKVTYQPDQPDQFIHTYNYDDDNRLVREYTSHQGLIYHNDQKQFYYLHGPVGRTETGQHKVQGQDYMYSIQGWLKGVNGAVLNQHTEAGKDGRQENICLSTYSTTPNYISTQTNLHSRIGVDAMGYVLSYYDNNSGGAHTAAEDYKPINTNSYSVLADINSQNISARNLYNGNIKQMSVALMKPNSSSGVSGGNVPYASEAIGLITWQYKYDQLQRLTNATALTGTTVSTYSALANNSEYKNTFTYDANGNILSQLRNGNLANLNLDNLTYNYASATGGGSTNKLSSVTENLATGNNSNYPEDIDNVVHGTGYTYDEIGNLKTDARNFITAIKWNLYGKVTEVIKNKAIKFDDWDSSGTQNGSEPTVNLSDIEYRYNEIGLRVLKIVKPHDATASDLTDQDHWTYTYYSYDASGNLMGAYERHFTTPTTTYDDVLKLKEHSIYGSDRIGTVAYNDEVAKNTYTYSSTSSHIFVGASPSATSYSLNVTNEKRTLGTRLYEMKNHLSASILTVSDKKIPVFENVTTCSSTVTYNNTFTHYTADVQSVNDVGCFGVILSGRSFTSTAGRFLFNANEREDEIYGSGNAYSTEFWMYDSRLGRRWNQDPISFADESPYSTFLNNPIYFSDALGLTAEGGSSGSGNDNHGDLALINDLEANGKHPDNGGKKKPSTINPAGQNKQILNQAVQQTVVYIKQNIEFQTKNLDKPKEEAPKPKETLKEYYNNMGENKWNHGDYVEWFGYKLKSAGMDDAKDAELAKEAKPIAEFAADCNPLMEAGHIINGICTDKDAYGNEMEAEDYAFKVASLLPWGHFISSGKTITKLTKKGVQKIGNLMQHASSKASDVLKLRGGHASALRIGRTDYWDKTLGEIANLAAEGDAEAETIMKLIKQAGSKAQKYGGN